MVSPLSFIIKNLRRQSPKSQSARSGGPGRPGAVPRYVGSAWVRFCAAWATAPLLDGRASLVTLCGKKPLGVAAERIFSEASYGGLSNNANPCISDTIQNLCAIRLSTSHRLHTDFIGLMVFETLKKVPLLVRPAYGENLSDLPKVGTKAFEMIGRTFKLCFRLDRDGYSWE